MKTSRANSFRLHRVNSRNDSARKNSQTFYDPDDTFKLAALNSVSRGVKHADLSYLTGMNLNKLRVQPLEGNEGEYNSAHTNLSDVRKRYDQMKKQRVVLQERIARMKEEAGKFTIFKREYEQKTGTANSRVKELQESLLQTKSELQVTVIEKKVLLALEARHRTDRVLYDQRKFDAEQELSFLRKQLKIFKKEGLEIGQSEDRTTKIYEKLSREIDAQKHEREEHIRSLQDMIEEKVALLNSNQEREGDLHEIAERAIQDKDLTEKEWRKIFMTHTFLNKLLRNKIEKEMQKFRIVEFAFKEIKTATGVTDAKQLVNKYLTKETVYGELLGKIADNEKTIERLKGETEQLNQNCKVQEMELQVLHSIRIKSQDLHDHIKQLEEYDHRNIVAEGLTNKLRQWTVRQMKKLSAIDKNYEESESPGSHSKFVQLFARYAKAIGKETEGDASNIDLSKVEVPSLSSHQTDKITRIMPRKSRQNSIGQEIFDVEEEETNPNSLVEEQDLINVQREELLRNNERFMREAKRRKDEERKLLIEKGDKHEKSPLKPAEAKKNQQG